MSLNTCSGVNPRARTAAAGAPQPVVLFMKGSPESPQCGFSKQVPLLHLISAHITSYTADAINMFFCLNQAKGQFL